MSDILKIPVELSNFEGQSTVTVAEVIGLAQMTIEEEEYRKGFYAGDEFGQKKVEAVTENPFNKRPEDQA